MPLIDRDELAPEFQPDDAHVQGFHLVPFRLFGGSGSRARVARAESRRAKSVGGALLELCGDQPAEVLQRDARVLVGLDPALMKARLHRQVAVEADLAQSVDETGELAVPLAGREPVI